MTPNQVAEQLRTIATKIDASKSPNHHAVAADLKSIVAQMEQQALPKSTGGKDMLKKFLDDAGKALDAGDDNAFKEMIEKLSKHNV